MADVTALVLRERESIVRWLRHEAAGTRVKAFADVLTLAALGIEAGKHYEADFAPGASGAARG